MMHGVGVAQQVTLWSRCATGAVTFVGQRGWDLVFEGLAQNFFVEMKFSGSGGIVERLILGIAQICH
jgi:hypothetical protein